MSCKISWSQLPAFEKEKRPEELSINLIFPKEVNDTNSALSRSELKTKSCSAAAKNKACRLDWGSQSSVHTCVFSERVEKLQKGTQTI